MEHWSDDEYESEEGEDDDNDDEDEEECDCGCSSPPRLLSSVGVGTEETVFTEQARKLQAFFCCNGSYTGPVYRDFTVPYPSVLWNHIECVFFYFHENTIWTLPHEYLIAEHFDIIPSQRNLKV